MNLFRGKSKQTSQNDYETEEIIKRFMEEKDSRENKIDTLENTTDINLFFDTIKTLDDVDNVTLEKGLIDRCFEEIDFTKKENLDYLYTKLKLYKNDFKEETLKYIAKLFKYCVDNYINR